MVDGDLEDDSLRYDPSPSLVGAWRNPQGAQNDLMRNHFGHLYFTPPLPLPLPIDFHFAFVFLCFPSSYHLFCQVFPGHRLAHLLPLAHLATSQLPPLFHHGQPPLQGRPPGPPRGPPGPRLTPLTMALQLPSLLCLNACLQKVPIPRNFFVCS